MVHVDKEIFADPKRLTKLLTKPARLAAGKRARWVRALRFLAFFFHASYLHPKSSRKIINYVKGSELKHSLAVALLVFAMCGSAAVWKLTCEAAPALRTKEVPLLDIVHHRADAYR